MFSRVLFPALMEAGGRETNAVVVIVVRRYAGLVVFVGMLSGQFRSVDFCSAPVVLKDAMMPRACLWTTRAYC
ncbi:MAG: hypothetical protein LV481_04585 [Methylacidiphilales bacterium]|nr:hypothetical protein [Candidatus Methylacidiphilales bacterium]